MHPALKARLTLTRASISAIRRVASADDMHLQI